MRRWTLWLSLFLLGLFALGCGGGGGGDTRVIVTVAPSSVTVIVTGTQQFFAAVSGATDTSVKWFVNDVEGGNSTVGTISTTGLYIAPATVPTPATVTVKATSNASPTVNGTATVTLDSGIRVSSVAPNKATVGTGETLQFRATVTCFLSPCNTAVNWTLSNTTTGGSIDASGKYTAPLSPPTPNTVTVTATSQADPTKTNTATVSIVTATDPTLTGINPSSVAQGSLFQDVYLTGTNFISTTQVLVNCTTPPCTTPPGLEVTAVGTSGNLLRVRFPDSFLATAAPAGVPVTVSKQGGTPFTPPLSFKIVPVRPALVGASPDSGTQGGGAFSFNVNGGYFGTASSPAVTAEFDGGVRAATVTSRQLSVTIGSSDLTAPGLISLAVRNAAAAQPVAVTNLAVQPSSANIPTAPVATLDVGMLPGAVAINTATRIAVVANRGSNNLTLIDFAMSPPTIVPGGPIPVGMSPTGVAVDSVRDLAVVANNGDNSVSVVNLATRAVTTIKDNTINSKPFSVGVNPQVGLALVAYQSANVASIIDLTASAPVVVGATTVSTGLNPQVAIEPRLNWGIITPGSAGSLSIANLGGRRSLVIAAAPTGAVRAGNAVTITTTAPHGLIANQVVLITGVSDAGFNGAFTVASVPSATTFTYAQTAANATSGGGLVVDPGLQTSTGIAANGASCSGNTATITTTAPHGLTTSPVPSAVLITGVGDTRFNGYFTVSQVPSSTTFTYTLTCAAPISSGGGAALYSNALATVTLGTGVTGVGINPETEKAILADPTTNTLMVFSVLDQTVTSFTLPDNCPSTLVCAFAAAINPLTDTGVSVNPTTNRATVVNPRATNQASLVLATVSVGTGPKAVAIDPGSNLAVVVNETPGQPNGTVSILSLGAVSGPGAIRPLHITQINPFFTFTSIPATPVTVTLIGTGFTSGSTVRLDGGSTGVITSFDSTKPRLLTATIDPSRLGGPRRYALDVLNPGGIHSNVTDFTVIQSVDLRGTGCANPQPRAVAIDPERNLAVVTNPNCNNISLIDLTTGAPTASSPLAVGKNPQGVAVISRLGKAVVTNRGDNNASLVDLVKQSVGATPVPVGTEPIGVAINPDTAVAVVANSAFNTVSLFSISGDTPGAVSNVSVDQRPVAVAIDPVRNLAVVATATQNNLDLIDLSQPTPSVTARIPGAQLPTAVVFDPVTGFFVATSSLANNLLILDPDRQQLLPVRVGINPTSLAYNFQSSTLVTVNTASNTVSVMDFIDRRVRAVLGSNIAPQCQLPIIVGTGSQQVAQQPPCGVDIHPRTNLGVFVDGDNNRLLLVPLPR